MIFMLGKQDYETQFDNFSLSLSSDRVQFKSRSLGSVSSDCLPSSNGLRIGRVIGFPHSIPLQLNKRSSVVSAQQNHVPGVWNRPRPHPPLKVWSGSVGATKKAKAGERSFIDTTRAVLSLLRVCPGNVRPPATRSITANLKNGSQIAHGGFGNPLVKQIGKN